MSLVILFHFLCAQHVSDINISIIQPHRNSNTHRTKKNTTNVLIQQNSLKFLMMHILMPETCWAHKKWNKIASDIMLVFYSSTITMMHGPINIRFVFVQSNTTQVYFNRLDCSHTCVTRFDLYLVHPQARQQKKPTQEGTIKILRVTSTFLVFVVSKCTGCAMQKL